MPTVLPSDFLRLKAIYSESSERWHQGFHYDICKDCREDPPTIIEDFQTGDVICGSCGLVLESNLVDTRPEWRTFSNDDSISGADPNRVGDGPDESLIGDQLSTSISFIGGSDSTNQALQRAQNKIVKDGQDGKMNQNLKAAFATLSAYISAAHLSKVVNDTAIKIMKVCMMEKCIKTTPSCVECAVIIYKATKAVGEAREIKECMRIVCLDQLKRKAFNAAYKRIDQVLREMKKKIAQTSDMPRAVMSARQVLPRFCEQARLKAWQRSLTEAFADAVEDTQALDSRGPSNVAATSLYIVTALFGEPMAMKDAAMLAQFSTSETPNVIFL
ncbi:hypothetical protein EX30DRAFT_331031 [Ascodesmis nigricans]|uniref:General transcription factor TFIIB n=1 Tax=Ascodesmis nigricans TaxID=341454 RepID=A0A4S2MY24_9PEZI|nr:hypothetical protein EX30DRAFT_331031 [Ascodesmis nigricans]